jgi:phosphatidylserine/phosphatidylglycerophosphate/cardiolipin synthase-like enzyme
VENVPFNRSLNKDSRVRNYGATAGNEMKDGKYIHALWYKGLENTCAVAAQQQVEKRVILHSAYFIPPALLMKGFTKMIDGSWNCKNVRVTFLTNSIETTDLSVINVVARYQMMAFFQIYANRESLYGKMNSDRSAKFDYYEYKKSTTEANQSLHTKLSILGDDVIIGSANADIRSYYMDTNNGFYLHNAKNFSQEYAVWVDTLLKDQNITKDLTPAHVSGSITMERLRAEDKVIVDLVMKRWKSESPLKEKSRVRADELLGTLGKFVVDTTHMIMSKDFIVEIGDNQMEIDEKKLKKQTEVENKFNALLQIL